ncbi:MAG: hypothetical protein ACI9V1_000276 [Spirosomataceae bacterium]|jgi:hypothetical protein
MGFSIMSKTILVDQTIQKLPASKIEEKILNEGMLKLTSESNAFKFLEDEEELYSANDLKETY